VHDRPAVVAAGDVGCREHLDHTGQRANRVERQAGQAPVRHRRQAERRVQRAGELGHVVDVGGLARDVQVRGFVRMGHADTGRGHVDAGFGDGGFVGLVHRCSRHAVARAHTLTACGGNGSRGRVSSQKRCNKPPATARR
jgi:hypothetical protein